ncbi:MAG: hypothetical protein IJ275_03395 [Ruminococcus sp.]|nr:hypothetical protein [Ruminococcus sp.]
MVEYKLQTQTTLISDSTTLTSYGILAFCGKRLVATVKDISSDKSAVEKLIQKFNTHGLSLCHLEQAVEDYLYNLDIN